VPGELVVIRIPTEAEEAVRDLCRARADMVLDLTRARNRLGKFLLRHSVIWRGGSSWSLEHRRWLETRQFEDKALALTYSHYRAVLSAREAALDAVEADLREFYGRAPFADTVSRLSCYRGVERLGALTIACEVCDFRRFGIAEQFASFTGLIPSEHSSGGSRHQGGVTKAGNAHLRTQLVESAWAYQHRPRVGTVLKKRQEGVPRRRSSVPGRRSCDCAGASATSPRERTCVLSSPRQWHESSPASSGPRWSPEDRARVSSPRPRTGRLMESEP
jgi:transposase